MTPLGAGDTDLAVYRSGTVSLFRGVTLQGAEWLSRACSSEGWQWVGGHLAVSRRMTDDLVHRAQQDGLVVANTRKLTEETLIMDAEAVATAIVEYYQANRGVGHTHTVLNGAANADRGAILLAANEGHANSLRGKVGPQVDVVSMRSLPESLRAQEKPLVVDNGGLFELLARLLRELADVRDAFDNLRDRNQEAS